MPRLWFVNPEKHARKIFRFGSGDKNLWNQNEKILAPRFSEHRNGKFTSLNRLEEEALSLS
nr:hypothetical protein [Porphyromonas gingivalis]